MNGCDFLHVPVAVEIHIVLAGLELPNIDVGALQKGDAVLGEGALGIVTLLGFHCQHILRLFHQRVIGFPLGVPNFFRLFLLLVDFALLFQQLFDRTTGAGGDLIQPLLGQVHGLLGRLDPALIAGITRIHDTGCGFLIAQL